MATETVSTSRVRAAGSRLQRAASEGATRGVRETAARQHAELAASSQVGGVNLIGVMFAIIMAAAIGMIGTTVISSISQSVTSRDLESVSAANQTVYENASESIGTGFANAMGLTDIVFLVLMFVVVIGALFLARRAQQ
ncbi:hypothetical protein [Halarchaeum salinum]|uniref:Uncharacterized protein n=1 Tax=Halarchaeum salinum TaxID=489912 RepID=A0AAV3SA42_9EURY